MRLTPRAHIAPCLFVALIWSGTAHAQGKTDLPCSIATDDGADGKIDATETFTYNTAGHKTGSEWRQTGAEYIDEAFSYTLDEYGRVLSESRVTGTGGERCTVHHYKGFKEREKSETYPTSCSERDTLPKDVKPEVTTYVHSHDARGALTREAQYRGDVLVRELLYKRGRLSKVIAYTSKGRPDTTTHHHYRGKRLHKTTLECLPKARPGWVCSEEVFIYDRRRRNKIARVEVWGFDRDKKRTLKKQRVYEYGCWEGAKGKSPKP